MSTVQSLAALNGREISSTAIEGCVMTASSLRVCSIGASDPIHTAYDIFLRQHHCAISSAANYRELCAISTREVCDIAVLQSTLSRSDLQDSAFLVRRRWPSARILILRDDVQFLEDALYDHRVMPGINPEVLLSVIRSLAASLWYQEVQIVSHASR
jgi:hypothetical protein